MKLISDPPPMPCGAWLQGFAQELMDLKPGLPVDNALCCAMLAHATTWLLEPEEAAQYWLAATRVAALDVARIRRGLPP